MKDTLVRGRFAALVLVCAALTVGGVLMAARPAAASAMISCPPNTGGDLQSAINGNPGETVTVFGACHGNFDVTTNITIQGAAPGATSGDGSGPLLRIHGPVTVTVRSLSIAPGVTLLMNSPNNVFTNAGCVITRLAGVLRGAIGVATDVGSRALLETSPETSRSHRGQSGGIR